jgi:flagellar protein FliL
MTKTDATTDPTPNTAPKKGKAKKLILIGGGALATLGLGAGGGLYASGSLHGHAKHEDPNRPKLVERSDEPAEVSEGEGKEAPLKVGTVSVKNDLIRVDPTKYEVTYFPIEQNFTANLADGSGFVQIGLSLSTYYDGKIIGNIKRQIVPIRSAILMVLSEQDSATLSTPTGKQALQRKLCAAINRVLRDKEGFGGIDNVYFTNLVIQ